MSSNLTFTNNQHPYVFYSGTDVTTTWGEKKNVIAAGFEIVYKAVDSKKVATKEVIAESKEKATALFLSTFDSDEQPKIVAVEETVVTL